MRARSLSGAIGLRLIGSPVERRVRLLQTIHRPKTLTDSGRSPDEQN